MCASCSPTTTAKFAERKRDAAARLVRGEVIDAMCAIEGGLEHEMWPPAPISTTHWQANAPVLAKRLPHGSWSSVSIAYGRVLSLNRNEQGRAGAQLAGMDYDLLADDLKELQRAEDLLLWAAGDQMVRLQLHAELEARRVEAVGATAPPEAA